MHEPVPARSIEPRCPVVLALFMVLGLSMVLPGRIKVYPRWVPYLFFIVITALMVIVWRTKGNRRWLKAERVTLFIFCFVMGGGALTGLASLIQLMVIGSKAIDGVYLLTSSILLWATNVLIFSLLYWQIDLGGPEARLKPNQCRPDWLFPQATLPGDMVPNWHPVFVDYLFLSFTTATAFSPTDTLPLTSRAKIMMMMESMISLTNIAAIAARAINILGS